MKKKKTENVNKSMAKKFNFWHILGIVGLGFAGLGIVGGAVAGIRQAVIHQQKEKVYSVTFNLEDGKVKGKRGDDAKDMVAGINGEQNDFDNAYPWKAIKDVKDENGDYFVRIPKFYEKITYVAGETLTYSVTASPKKGYNVAPAFIQGDEEIDYIDIGKYEASIDKGGHLRSISGVMPETTGHTLDAYRSLAEADGNQLFDWRGNQALQSLFTVEFATLDSQSIMTGETHYVAMMHEVTAEEIAEKKVSELNFTIDEDCRIDTEGDLEKYFKANTKHVDITVDYTDEDEENIHFEKTVAAKKVVIENDETITVTIDQALDVSELPEDTGIYLSFGSYNYHKTGASDGRKGSSNGASLKSLENTAMNYRGVENWYGNTWTWCDGLATYQDDSSNKFVCVSMDATKNNDRSSYKRYAVSSMSASTALGDGLFFNQFDMDDEVSYQRDYFSFAFAEEAYRIGWVGGSCGGNAGAGAFCVGVSCTVSNANYSVRLSCVPQAL